MIVVKLSGGLGNQMFQYALGRTLALKHHTNLILNTAFLEDSNLNHTYRTYSLDKFKIQATLSNRDFNFKTNGKGLFNKIRALVPFDNEKLALVKEENFRFDKTVLKCSDNSYLEGYWQSYKYFQDSDNKIREDFNFSILVTERFREVLNKIKNENSVFIHVRRGDYVTNKETNLYHGVCDLEYYTKAIRLIEDQVKNPFFFIFSDDSEWVTENMNIKSEHIFVTDKLYSTAHIDLLLMSSCKHAIIANSSFSWWGAWLINNYEKVVIAPSKWFANPLLDTSDLIPDMWQKI